MWAPDGRRLAIGTVTSGRAGITVFRWPGGAREFDVVVDDVDEILSPTWSPDGRSIAFSAMSDGVTDPYVWDLVGAAAALVGDTTSHGAISPVRGERYRLEAAPAFGTIRYVNVLADYRRYLMPVPFYTLAARVLHIGRYGSGSTDIRVPPLYLGYPSLVRGYDLDSHIADQCVAPLSSGCEGLDHLLGSRIAVANPAAGWVFQFNFVPPL